MNQAPELNLRDYWNIFLKRKWIIIASFLGVVITTVFYTNLQPYLYRASAIIKVEQPQALSSNLFFERSLNFGYSELTDYAKQITSLPIIKKALRELKLITSDETEKDAQFVSTVASGLDAREIEKTNMINVQLVMRDPKRAALILNKICEMFKEENIRQKNRQAKNVREFIEEQLDKVTANLKQAEEKLKELTLKGVGGEATAIVDKMVQLESMRTDLLTKFTELHPDVKKIDEQIATLKEQLQNLPKEEFEFSSIKRDVLINERLYNSLREKLQEAQIKESEKIDNIIILSPAVEPRYPFSPNKPGNYLIGVVLGLVFGIFIGLVFEHLDTSIGRIEDLENVTKVNIIGVIPFNIENKEKKDFKHPRSFFGTKKKTKENKLEKLRNQLILKGNEHSLFLEAFRILGVNVQVIFGTEGRIKNKCMLITSSNPLEGKSMISSNLSVILAQMGYKTVIVDMDLRRSSIHKVFGLSKKNKGVTDLLAGEEDLENVVRTTTDLLLGDLGQEEVLKNPWMDNFHLILAGTTYPNSPYLLNTERLDWLIKTLKEKYDVVIIDSPPILAVSDTSIIVPKTDGIIFVYRAGTTSRIALRRAKMQVEGSKGEMKGIVLNNVTPEISTDSYYYYKHYYYGEPEKEV